MGGRGGGSGRGGGMGGGAANSTKQGMHGFNEGDVVEYNGEQVVVVTDVDSRVRVEYSDGDRSNVLPEDLKMVRKARMVSAGGMKFNMNDFNDKDIDHAISTIKDGMKFNKTMSASLTKRGEPNDLGSIKALNKSTLDFQEQLKAFQKEKASRKK
jgi:hypothetical protein